MQPVFRQFDAAAGTYHAAAEMQAMTARRLLARAAETASPQTILDLGCGTGMVGQEALQTWPQAALTAVDASPAMLDAARLRLPQAELVAADVAGFMPDRSYDLILSNMMLHWLPDPAAALRRWRSWLSRKGRLHVALLGQGSFSEWRKLCAGQGVPDGLWPMPEPGFAAGLGASAEQDRLTIAYPDAAAFLQRLKVTGTASPATGYRPMSPGQMRRVLRSAPQPFSVSYEVLYLSLSAQSPD